MFPLPVDTDSHQLFDSPAYTLLLSLQGRAVELL